MDDIDDDYEGSLISFRQKLLEDRIKGMPSLLRTASTPKDEVMFRHSLRGIGTSRKVGKSAKQELHEHINNWEPKKEKEMSNTKLTFLFDDVTTIKIKFKKDDDRSWTYKALKTDNIQVGDSVVVSTRNIDVIVIVTEVHEYPQVEEGVNYKWIIQRVDYTQYNSLVKRDTDATVIISKAEYEKKKQEAKDSLLAGLAINEDVQTLFQLKTDV